MRVAPVISIAKSGPRVQFRKVGVDNVVIEPLLVSRISIFRKSELCHGVVDLAVWRWPEEVLRPNPELDEVSVSVVSR
jgi:hypothetical protein